MTQSMTGFARGSVTTPQCSVIVELRSVNNRYLDLYFRCPDNVRQWEPQWRQQITKAFSRGKIEATIRVSENEEHQLSVNTEALEALKSALDSVRAHVPESSVPDQMALLLAPGVLQTDPVSEAALKAACCDAMAAAVSELVDQRQSEGAALRQLVLQRVNDVASRLVMLRGQLPELRQQQRQRLLDKLTAAAVQADPRRLEEELVYTAQRADVDEEMDRLDAHLTAITTALQGKEPCGRRLDFLMQELNREANTLSSKSTAIDTTNTAVEFKVLIEQMREQIQNIE